MNVYLGAVSEDKQYVGSLTSLYEMKRREGDELYIEHRTRGDVARESLLSDFRKKTQFDAYLALDADQRHPKHMLEQLREDMEKYDLDMVCAHYYRRDTGLIQSLCYAVGDGTYPFLPLLPVPREGLHEIAITGLGCVLIHRRVIEAVWATLPEGANPFAIGTMPDGKDDANWGSDFRFFILARRLGFKLWLDAGLESLHAVTLWLGHKSADKLVDYKKWAEGSYELWEERVKLHGMNSEALRQRQRILEAHKAGLLQQSRQYIGKPDMQQQLDEISVAIYQMDGRLMEVQAWLDVAEKYPAITKPQDLPTTATMPPQDHTAEGTTPEEIQASRKEMYRENAKDIVDQLPPLVGNGRR